MKKILIAATACAALGAWGQDNIQGMKFFALYERCKDAEFASTSSSRSPQMQLSGFGCIAYSMALLDRRRFFNFEESVYCLPKDVRMRDISMAIISFGDDLLKNQHDTTRLAIANTEGMAPIIFDVALKRAYPCSEKK